MNACWAVMFATAQPVDRLDEISTHGAPLEGTDVVRLTAEHLKPGRPQGAGLYVLHATPQWSQTHLESTPAQAADSLMIQLREHVEHAWVTQYVTAHRWRYAQTQTPLGRSFLLENGLGVCGDWCLGAHAEHGYLSGKALGEAFTA